MRGKSANFTIHERLSLPVIDQYLIVLTTYAYSLTGKSALNSEKIASCLAGIQPEFSKRKLPKNYRYDTSSAPKLNWNENVE